MYRKTWFTLGLLAVALPAYADVFEDFEDGDYTSNPTWYLEIDQGASVITDDPVRPSNLAYHVHGTSSGNRSLYTYVGGDVPWVGYDMSFEFLATDWGFHPQWDVATANLDYTLGFGFWLDPSWSTIRLYPSEYRTRLFDYAVEVQTSEFALNTWHKVHTFQDPQSGVVTTEIRVLDSDVLVAQLSYMPTVDFSQLDPMDTLWLGAEEVQWQLFDNVALVPEPATLGLAVVGVLSLTKRRLCL